jgi:hypothetical protein
LQHVLRKRARNKNLQTARKTLDENISKEKKEEKKYYDDPKQTRRQVASTDYFYHQKKKESYTQG